MFSGRTFIYIMASHNSSTPLQLNVITFFLCLCLCFLDLSVYWLECDRAQVFPPERLLCLTSFHMLVRAESRLYWWPCLWTVAWTPSHPHNYWHKTRDDRTSDSLGIEVKTFLLFQQINSALTSPNAQWGENLLRLHHRGRLRIH